MRSFFALLIFSLLSSAAFAQSVEVHDSDDNYAPIQESPAPKTGEGKASQYFQARKAPAERSSAVAGGTPHYLAVHIGTFFQDQTYEWGDQDNRNTGHFNGGVTYRLGEWVNSTDLAIRIEYTNFSLDSGSARALSFSPMLTFPDANSRFPLYFGGGVGLDMFIQQVHDRSPVALTWQVVAGARFMDVFNNVGFMVESGLKNHVMLLSRGQFNGVFINVGTVFAF